MKNTVPLLLAAVLAAAAALRFLGLDTYPPGWHHDEALMGVMASEVLSGLQRPIFFPAYLGQEPFYIYLVAAMMAFLGSQDVLAVRLVSAILGLGTVAVAYLLGKEMFGRRVGLLAAALLGTSFWHVMYSRDGFRAISQPLFEGLAVYFLWRARRTGSTWCYAASGAAFAATTYTYISGRTFPAVLVAFGLWSLWFERRLHRFTPRGVAIMAAAAILVALPIYIYWATHPGTFGSRMEQVFVLSPGVNKGQPLLYLADSVSRTLQMFTVHGEEMLRYNMSGRPVFVWPLVPFFYMGAAVVLWRALVRDAASVLLLLWMIVMLLPSMLSWDAGGYTLRNLAVLPALHLFPAIGAVVLWDVSSGFIRPGLRWAVPAALAAAVALDGGLTYRDYFLDWSRQFGTAYQTNADFVAEARFLAVTARPDRETVFAGSDYVGHPIVAQLAPAVYKQLRWLDGSNAVVYSPGGAKDSLYVLAFSTLPPEIDRYFPKEAFVAERRFAGGVLPDEPPPPLFVAYRLTPPQVQAQIDSWITAPETAKLSGKLGGRVELLAAQTPPKAVQGSELAIRAIWRVLGQPRNEDYVLFAHLVDHKGQMWVQSDRSGYPASQWRQGDVVVSYYGLSLPRDLPPGKYSVDFGIYDRRNGVRLAGDGASDRKALSLGSVKVSPSAPPMPSDVTNKLDRQLGDTIKLLGYDLSSRPAAHGGKEVRVKLLWSALKPSPEDYTVFVQLLGPDGKLVAQADSMPLDNRLPTGIWDAGDLILDEHTIVLKDAVPPASYRVIAGMYLLRTGERLRLPGGEDFVPIGQINLP